MSTKYYHRQGILERVLRSLFTTDKSMESVESSDLGNDQKLFEKMIQRRGLSKSVRVSKDKDRNSLIFKIK